MKNQVLHTVWCNIAGETAGEMWNWSLLGVNGLKRSPERKNFGHECSVLIVTLECTSESDTCSHARNWRCYEVYEEYVQYVQRQWRGAQPIGQETQPSSLAEAFGEEETAICPGKAGEETRDLATCFLLWAFVQYHVLLRVSLFSLLKYVLVMVCSCDGRVVKALDLKSNGVSPRRFEPCLQRLFFLLFE